MANTYKNIVITPNTNQGGDPTIVFSGGNANVNIDITARVYPDSNGTLSFEGTAGQLFSITNDLTGIIFSVNDVSGIPSISVSNTGNVALAEITGNVGVGRSNPTYLLDVDGTVNATSYLINGSSLGNTSNGWANTVGTYANNNTGVGIISALTTANGYANTVAAYSNNFGNIQIGWANTWANTKLSNSSVTLAGTLTTNGYIYITPPGGANEGGEIQLIGAGSTNTNWSIDSYINNFRIFSSTQSVNMNVHIFGGAGGSVNVGINRSNPTYTLDVAGSTNAASFLLNGSNIPGTSNTNPQAANYTLAVGDIGKTIIANGGNVFITTGIFNSGHFTYIYNNTAASITLTQNTGTTLYLPGTIAASNRILATRTLATVLCLFPGTFVVSGPGVT